MSKVTEVSGVRVGKFWSTGSYFQGTAVRWDTDTRIPIRITKMGRLVMSRLTLLHLPTWSGCCSSSCDTLVIVAVDRD